VQDSILLMVVQLTQKSKELKLMLVESVCANLCGFLHGVGVMIGAKGGVYDSVSLAKMVVVVV